MKNSHKFLQTTKSAASLLIKVLLSFRVLLTVLSVLFIFTGCEKEKSIFSSDLKKDATSEKFKVKNGELHFVNAETFRKDAIELMNLHEPEYWEWEKSMGFKSLRSWVREANNAFEKVESQEGFNHWKTKYGDVVEIINKEIRPIIEDPYSQAFANREGVFHIGQSFVKASKEKNVIIQDGDRSRLPEARMMNATDLDKGIVIDLHKNPDQAELRSGCISQEVSRTEGRNKVVYRFKTSASSWTGNYYTLIEISEYAKKKNFWGWNDGDAMLEWKGCSWQVTDNNNVSHTVTNQFFNSNFQRVHKISTYIDCFDDTPPSSYILPNFNYRKGRATSDLLDWNKYAVSCCGFDYSQCPEGND